MNCKHVQELLKLMAEHELTFVGFVDARPELRCGTCRFVEVEVTQQDIGYGRALVENGHNRNKHCPTALAARRALGGGTVSCGATSLDVVDEKSRSVYQLPLEATKFILDFDSGKPR